MTDIYKQHESAFARVSAYVVLHNGERVATIAFKFPADGAGRLWSYVHWLGLEMTRGHAGGYGYDKRSAACAVAARKITATGEQVFDRAPELRAAFIAALARDGGQTWDSALRDAGFVVLQAV